MNAIRQPHTDSTGNCPAGALRCAFATCIRSMTGGLTGLPAK
jgi:hypothetical protein